ncbi:MAG: thioesterase family protein [Oscillospiraceae bacterium]|nr:thioesterase family protein [Oscillospiraceae bacterium]
MLETGIKGNGETVVTEALTARVFGSGELDVYATPAMIALAEETALKSVADRLEPGQGTVGTRVDVAHLAATPLGMKVRCETDLIEIDRRRLTFSVRVFDEVEKIAEGTHERFVIDNEKFLKKAGAKGAAQG